MGISITQGRVPTASHFKHRMWTWVIIGILFAALSLWFMWLAVEINTLSPGHNGSWVMLIIACILALSCVQSFIAGQNADLQYAHFYEEVEEGVVTSKIKGRRPNKGYVVIKGTNRAGEPTEALKPVNDDQYARTSPGDPWPLTDE